MSARSLAIAALLLLCAAAADAQDANRGAMLYMRTTDGSRSCVSCHGADPAANPNNILRAADQPDTLTRVLNTVSPMGFLRPLLTDEDRADLSAFLGAVVAQSGPGGLQIWPTTLEFGTVQAGNASAEQNVRILNSGTATRTLGPLRVLGAGFSLQHDCPASLGAGAFCEATVTARADVSGWARAAVQVEQGGAGRALQAGASVLGTPEPASQLRWPDAADGVLRLPSAALGSAAPMRLALANSGPMPAVLGSVTVVGPQAALFRVEERCTGVSVLQAGTRCDLVISYTAGRSAAEAVLQLRSDQGNPPTLRLEGAALPEVTAAPPEALPLTEGGGGCSVGPPDRPHDPLLALLAALAAASLGARTRRSRG